MTGAGIRFRIGPITVVIRSSLPAVQEGVALHYAQHDLVPDVDFADFHLALERSRRLSPWLRSQVVFRFGGTSPFKPLPLEQAFALLEWGINWSIATHCHQYLILHAAVVAHDDLALVLPAPPGSGKSTLCAALVAHGWRLLSDELTIIERETGSVVPLPRPISLKNRSIDAVKNFWPDVIVGDPVRKTLKGTVTYVKPPGSSISAAGQHAMPRWIVLPRYSNNQPTRLTAVSKATAFMQLVENAFNYDVHGRDGFEQLARVIEASDCFEFEYGGALEEAVDVFEEIAARPWS